MQSSLRFFLISVIFLVLSACASLPDDNNLHNHAESVSSSSRLSSASFLQRAKLKLQKGKSESLHLYAPSYLENAQNAYKEAHQAYKDKEDDNTIKLQTQLSIEYIESGMRNKKVVKGTLKKSLKNRQLLLTLKANKHFAQDFNDVEEGFLNLVRSIEQRKLDAAQTQEREVLVKMRALEIKTIGFTYLSTAQKMLEKAQLQDAEALLPKTYLYTLDVLQKARSFIGKHPRKKSKIKQLTHSSAFASQRLYYLARHAKRLQNMEESSIEKAVLLHEKQLQRISDAAKLPTVGNQSFNDQSIVLAEKITALKINKKKKGKDDKVTAAQLDRWKRNVVLLQREVKRLKAKLNK